MCVRAHPSFNVRVPAHVRSLTTHTHKWHAQQIDLAHNISCGWRLRAYVRFYTRTHEEGVSPARTHISHNNELCRFSQFQLTSHAARTTLRSRRCSVCVCVRWSVCAVCCVVRPTWLQRVECRRATATALPCGFASSARA